MKTNDKKTIDQTVSKIVSDSIAEIDWDGFAKAVSNILSEYKPKPKKSKKIK